MRQTFISSDKAFMTYLKGMTCVAHDADCGDRGAKGRR
jgi:hypothetical protein